MGVLRPDLMMKCIVPVVMAGIIAVRWRPLFGADALLACVAWCSSLTLYRLPFPTFPPSARWLARNLGRNLFGPLDLRSRRLSPHLG